MSYPKTTQELHAKLEENPKNIIKDQDRGFFVTDRHGRRFLFVPWNMEHDEFLRTIGQLIALGFLIFTMVIVIWK
jgi:hypothetical protein